VGRRPALLSVLLIAVVSIVLGGCASPTGQSVVQGDPATLVISQYGDGDPGNDPKVYTPFFATGSKYSPNVNVTINIMKAKAKEPLVSTTTLSSASGTVSAQIAKDLPADSYTLSALVGGQEVAKKNFQALGPNPRKTGTVRVVGEGVPNLLVYPTVKDGEVYIAQSANGGSIYSWPLAALPAAGRDTAVKPSQQITPKVPASVKMEQINWDNSGKQLLVGRKAMNVNATGGNSIWSYAWDGKDTGASTQLFGNEAPAGNGYFAWGPGSGQNPNSTAEVANAYTSKNFPTKTPKEVAIGDGAGVLQAANGYYYFSSLQSGCIYKGDEDAQSAATVYCMPSWGVGNGNASAYSLAEDGAGNVYAVYYGTTDAATTILKIKPGGSSDDKVSAIRVEGYGRSVGLAVSSDGSRLFTNGVTTAAYNTNTTNTILEITDPSWGDVGKPTPTKAKATVLPGAAGEVYLGGMAFDAQENRLIIADTTGGFYVAYL